MALNPPKKAFVGDVKVSSFLKLFFLFETNFVKVERNKLTGKLMRAEMKGDKKRIAELRERLDALPDETVVVTTAKVDKSGRIRPEHSGGTERAAKDDIAALVRAEREDQGDAMRVSEAALMKAASKNIIRGGGLDELFEGTASKRARREKIGNEDELERKRSKQIHRYYQYYFSLIIRSFKDTSKL